MMIYGVAILAFCYMIGQCIGQVLGTLLNINVNVGGVGFAMLILIFITDFMKRKNRLPTMSEDGILFWRAMYIPIIVSIASTQDVVGAVSGGLIAIFAGIIPAFICILLLPIIVRYCRHSDKCYEHQKTDENLNIDYDERKERK